MDATPQRVLVHHMKRAIDLMSRDPNALARLMRMVSENPRSALSTHVLKNLGRTRATILLTLIDREEERHREWPEWYGSPRARAGTSFLPHPQLAEAARRRLQEEPE